MKADLTYEQRNPNSDSEFLLIKIHMAKGENKPTITGAAGGRFSLPIFIVMTVLESNLATYFQSCRNIYIL